MNLGNACGIPAFTAISASLVSCPLQAKVVELPSNVFAQLKSQDFKSRESAESELLLWGRERPGPAMDELLRQSRIADDPEVRQRCLNVLRELVIDEYLKDGEGYLGIMMGDAIENVPGDEKPRSVINVVQVVPDSAAQRGGLQPNDVIIALDDFIWREGAARLPFSEKIRAKKPNTKVALKVIRNGKIIELPITLGRRPPLQDNLFLNDPNFDPQAIERADKEAYFRRWLSLRKLAD